MNGMRARVVEWLVAAAAGAALLLLSGQLVLPPPEVPKGHPERFVEIAQAPFAFAGQFAHRLLWPLLAHVAGQVGVGPIAFSQACLAALLAVVFWFARRRGATWWGAMLVAAAVAASGAVNVYKPLTCLSDPLNLLLLVLAVHFVARPVLFWALVLLASLSHEMVFFFAPWLVWLRVREGGGTWSRDGLALVATLAAYAGWRLLVAALAPPAAAAGGGYDAAYYIANNFWVPWGMPSMWALFGFVVVAEFGPLLVLAALAWRAREPGLGGAPGQWLYLACVLSLMLLAYDVFRFASFVFLPVVLGGIALARTAAGRSLLALLVTVAAAVWLWRHPIPSEFGGRAYSEIAQQVMALLAPYYLPATGTFRQFTVGEGFAFLGDLLARAWLPFVWAAVAAIAYGLAGAWLARRGANGTAPRRA
jgi:hypothetical protein